MADAKKLLDARDVDEMPPETNAASGKKINGADNFDWGMKNRLSRLIGGKQGRS